MKRALHIICLILAALLLPAALRIFPGLPLDSSDFAEKKYAGWSGVLRAWLCCRWQPGGSFMTWLNRCAGEFEKSHPGVYLEFTPVTEAAVAEMDSGLRLPELLFFSPGVGVSLPLEELPAPTGLRPGLSAGTTVPVAMGAYTLVFDRAIGTDAPPAIPRDEPGRCFSRAAEHLRSRTEDEAPLPEPGIDLGLPAMADGGDVAGAFIAGKLPCFVAGQRELARLIAQRENGRGPDWAAGPVSAFTDQLLLGAVPVQADADAPERTPLAMDFLAFLLEEERQAELGGIGAFPVTGATAYGHASPYAAAEAGLAALPRILT